MAVWAGVLAERAGDGEQADAAYAAAREALNGDEVRFWLLQSEVRQRIGDVEGAVAAADKALALAPDSAEAFFFKGKAAAMAGDRETALEALDLRYPRRAGTFLP